jgi:hypothetical protein
MALTLLHFLVVALSADGSPPKSSLPNFRYYVGGVLDFAARPISEIDLNQAIFVARSARCLCATVHLPLPQNWMPRSGLFR